MKPIGNVAAQVVATVARAREANAMDWNDLLSPEHRKSPLIHADAAPADVARHCDGIAYLATPYTREVLVKGRWNYERSVLLSTMASRHMVMLMRERVTAISPIVLASEALHAQGSTGGKRLDPLDHGFWTDWCRPFLHKAKVLVVPNIPGWDRSEGIWGEVQFALDHNVPVFVYARPR